MLKLILATLLFFLLAAPAHAALCTLTWDANSESDLAGYSVYSSVTSQNYQGSVPLNIPAPLTTTTCEALGIGEDGLLHYFILSAYDTSNNWSGFSNEVSKLMPSPPPPPPPPPPPVLVCKKFNRKGMCTKWGY